MTKLDLRHLIEDYLQGTVDRCEFKKAWIPSGWTCVPVKRFAEELANVIMEKITEAKS